MSKTFWIIGAVMAAAVVCVNTFFTTPPFDDPQKELDFLRRSQQYIVAERHLLNMLAEDSFRIDTHYDYIRNHFDIPMRTRKGKRSYTYRDDKTILYYYTAFSMVHDTARHDIGYYGQGLIRAQEGDYSGAIYKYTFVYNRRLRYLQNSLGNAYLQTHVYDSAEVCFRREIANNGNISGAYSNLADLYLETGREEQVAVLLRDPVSRPFVSLQAEKQLYFATGNVTGYFDVLFRMLSGSVNSWGFVAALLILVCWVYYLREIDIFERERWRHIIVTVLLGMLFSFLVFPVSDYDRIVLGFRLNGNVFNDFLYSVFVIGVVEELVKIIPLLIMIRFTKAVNEPFDYIKYAALSALGFAFVENLMYFSTDNLQVIHGRMVSAVVAHMVYSSIIAYGIILGRYKGEGNVYANFFMFLGVAALAHGFYDFWLISSAVSGFGIISILFLVASVVVWNSLKNNALNQSNFFIPGRAVRQKFLENYLVYALCGLLLFEYIAVAFQYGPDVGTKELLQSLMSGTYLLLFLSGTLSRFTLRKGKWNEIRYWPRKGEE